MTHSASSTHPLCESALLLIIMRKSAVSFEVSNLQCCELLMSLKMSHNIEDTPKHVDHTCHQLS